MRRRHDWPERLADYLASVHEKPHHYGQHDCLLFPAGAVKAVTGHDFGRGHRRKYKSQATAVRHLKGMGFDSPEALLDSLFEETPVGFAQRGDLALVPGDELPGGEMGWAIPAVVYGAEAAVINDSGEREGLVRIPRAQWVKAWKVG